MKKCKILLWALIIAACQCVDLFAQTKANTISLEVTAPPSMMSSFTYYDSQPIFLDKAVIESSLGISADELEDATKNRSVVFEGLNSNGTSTTTSTAIAPGFWFDSRGNVTNKWDDYLIFCELDAKSCMLNVGQYPNCMNDGDKFLMSVALKTTQPDAEGYTHRLVMNITLHISYNALLPAVPAQEGDLCIENCRVNTFLKDVEYEPSDTSRVTRYNVSSYYRLDNPADLPAGWLALTGATLDNLTPGLTYGYRQFVGAELVESTFTATGQLRMLKTRNVANVRDMGGWNTTSGHKIRYGLLYRGSELNGGHIATTNDVKILLEAGILADLDLRDESETKNITASPLGKEVKYLNIPSFKYYDNGIINAPNKYKEALEFIVAQLREDRPVYYHCVWGCDRTGTLGFMLGGLLGMSYSDLCKDFELSTFSAFGTVRTKKSLDNAYAYILTLEGETQQEKFYTYWSKVAGVSDEDISDFCTVMLGTRNHYIVNAIEEVTENAPNEDTHSSFVQGTYDLSGRALGTLLPGLNRRIYIQNKKKVMR